MIRAGIATLISDFPNIKLVGEASNGKELIRLAEELAPDIIMTDIRMPVIDGIMATMLILAQQPQIGVIGLTAFEDEELIIQMFDAGAKGYMIKSSGKLEILEAIQSVREGKFYHCHKTSKKLAQYVARNHHVKDNESPAKKFTAREHEVIQLICQQYSNKEIASKLKLSIRTIEGHRDRIQEKMDTRNSVGVVIYSIRNGLFDV